MYVLLAAFAGILALIVAGFGSFAAWAVWSGRSREIRSSLLRWSIFDYVLLALFLIGTVFLLADVAGVLSNRDRYPYFHLGYLLSGFVYNLLAGVFLFVRLGLTVRMLSEGQASRGAAAAHDDHRKPNKA